MKVQLLLLCLSVSLAGCFARGFHPTQVQSGKYIQVTGGYAKALSAKSTEPYRPPQDGDFWVAELSGGIGHRFDDDAGVQMSVIVPLEDPPTSLLGSGFDVYFQALGSPVDLGFGVIASLMPEIYGQVGDQIEVGGSLLGWDLGLRLSYLQDDDEETKFAVLSPYGLLTFQHGFFRMIGWLEFSNFLMGDLEVSNDENDSSAGETLFNNVISVGLSLGLLF